MTANNSTHGQSVNSVPLTVNEVTIAIDNPRRRKVLDILDAVDGPISLDELSRAIASAENDVRLQLVAYDQRQRVYIALYQHHLDKLDAIGAIEYWDQKGEIRPTDATEKLAELVRLIEEICTDSIISEPASPGSRTVSVDMH
jgi:hypothetical protein